MIQVDDILAIADFLAKENTRWHSTVTSVKKSSHFKQTCVDNRQAVSGSTTGETTEALEPAMNTQSADNTKTSSWSSRFTLPNGSVHLESWAEEFLGESLRMYKGHGVRVFPIKSETEAEPHDVVTFEEAVIALKEAVADFPVKVSVYYLLISVVSLQIQNETFLGCFDLMNSMCQYKIE